MQKQAELLPTPRNLDSEKPKSTVRRREKQWMRCPAVHPSFWFRASPRNLRIARLRTGWYDQISASFATGRITHPQREELSQRIRLPSPFVCLSEELKKICWHYIHREFSVANFEVVITSVALLSGIFEGLNNKAKVTIRRTGSFRTFKMPYHMLNHVLRELPEPKSTYRFC